MSSMGARIGDVLPEFRALSILAVLYSLAALGVMYRRYIIHKKYEEEQKEALTTTQEKESIG